MGFKEFITERPYFIFDKKVKGPKGDTIDGADEKYKFDFAVEFMPKDDPVRKELEKKYHPLVPDMTGHLPMYCNKHDLLFMYDFDKNKYIKATGEEKKDLLKLQKAMKKHPDYKGKNIKVFS